MNKIFKKVISLALIGTLCIDASTTTFASELSPEAKAEATQTNESERKVNWWQVGWKVLSDYFEKLIDLDGQSVKDSNWAYLVSPSIEFNTGEMGNEVYFKPEVNNSVGSMRMHGHRVIFVDIFAKINLILSDANNDTVSSAVTETNQYMFYDKKASDPAGKWKAQFISSESFKWQCYYAHYYNANTRSALPEVEDGFYFGDNNRVFQFSENPSPATLANNKILTMTELNNQFINPADGEAVDYLKDYAPGDEVHFADKVIDITYNADEKATTIFFDEKVSGDLIGWKFNGDLTNEYAIGDTVSLNFNVVKIGEYNNIIFESLDYFEEAFSHEDGGKYPDINNYR